MEVVVGRRFKCFLQAFFSTFTLQQIALSAAVSHWVDIAD
jgi:hypothetical protein